MTVASLVAKLISRDWVAAQTLDDPKLYEIHRGISTIGRDTMCEVKLRCPTVSKLHAEIRATCIDGNCTIELQDLGSINGTRVNMIPLDPNRFYQLKNNDEISFGRSNAKLVVESKFANI